MIRRVAVIDVGKTNAKLALVDLADLSELAVRTRPNLVLQTAPYPHYDLEGHWRFFCEGLREFHRDFGVDAVSITTHGAAATLIGHDGQALPMLDYEHSGPDELADAYDAIRPDFIKTGSARLPMGLNLGAQLHWQFTSDPSLRAQVKHIVTYPQYWGYLLTGMLACDICSLGCHTDLWLPEQTKFSSLVDHLGIRDLLAPPRRPADVLGGISAQAAAQTGLPKGLPVAVGIHDSNASLYRHLLARKGPFSVVSTGTWVIAMAMRGDRIDLDPTQDTLINVNGLGEPVPSARFMGGRLFDQINEGWVGTASEDDRQSVLDRGVMLLPAKLARAGALDVAKPNWTVQPENAGQRYIALSYYLAVLTHRSLEQTGAVGSCLVEGPFARNADYLCMLSSLRAGKVEAMKSATGTSDGAALLLAESPLVADAGVQCAADANLSVYGRKWLDLVAAH